MKNPNEFSRNEIKLMEETIKASRNSKAEDPQKITPEVGAGILFPNGEIVTASRGELGEGDHAEFTLLQKKVNGRDLSGCILATTLEPCTTRKKHTPCSEWILGSKIKDVIVAVLDPNPFIYTHGIRKLQNGKIRVRFFPESLRNEVETIIQAFREQYHKSQAAFAEIKFDYEKNDYTFGTGIAEFETKWSTARKGKIYCHSKNGSTLAISNESTISEIKNSSVLTFTAKSLIVSEKEIIVIKNKSGRFLAIEIQKAEPREIHQPSAILQVKYKICDNSTGDFSKEEDPYTIEKITEYTPDWAEKTIRNLVKTKVSPTLERANGENLFWKIGLAGGLTGLLPQQAPTEIWSEIQKKEEIGNPRIVHQDETCNTFKISVVKTRELQEKISLEKKYEKESWEIDIRINKENNNPREILVTRIIDTTADKGILCKELPIIDINEYL